LVPVKGW